MKGAQVNGKRAKAGTSKAAAAQRKSLFVEAYCSNGNNGKQAAITAGYAPGSAEVTASKLLRDPKVAAAVKERQEKVVAAAEEQSGLTVAGVLRELHGIVHSDLRKAFDPKTGALLPPHQWPDELAMCMSSVKVVEMAGGMGVDGEEGVSHVPMYTKEVKFWDKNAAIDKAMKHLGLFKEDNKQQGEAACLALHVAFGK